MSEFQYFSLFLLYALGFLSILRKAQRRISVCRMSVGLSQLLDFHLSSTLRASSLFFSTPKNKNNNTIYYNRQSITGNVAQVYRQD